MPEVVEIVRKPLVEQKGPCLAPCSFPLAGSREWLVRVTYERREGAGTVVALGTQHVPAAGLPMSCLLLLPFPASTIAPKLDNDRRTILGDQLHGSGC